MASDKLNRFLWNLSAKLKARIVIEDSLERYYLGRIFGRTFFLHRFTKPDSGRDLHNHPWNAKSLILVGGYLEYRRRYAVINQIHSSTYGRWVPLNREEMYLRSTGDLIKLEERDFHTIGNLFTPVVWTLFWHTKRYRKWGFIDKHENFSLAAAEITKSIFEVKWYDSEACPRGRDIKRTFIPVEQ